jgi:hypothetical protein
VRYIALPWEIKDRLNRYLTWTSWALMALSLATFFLDFPSRYLEIALALYLPAIMFSTIRDWRSLNKDVAEMREQSERIERMLDAKTFRDLSPEDQEEIMIRVAKNRLKDT